MTLRLADIRRPYLLVIGFALFTFFTWAAISHTLLASQHQLVGELAAFDLTFGLAGLWYFGLVRRGRVAPLTLIPVTMLGLLAARFAVLPQQRATIVPLLVGSAVELGAVALFVVAIRRARSSGRTSIGEVLESLTGSRVVARVIESEFSIFDLALFSWRRAEPRSERTFTLHRESGWITVAAGLTLAIVVESIGMHLWLHSRAPIVAIVLALLDAYSILWVIADYRAMSLKPTDFGEEALTLRAGWRWSAEVPLTHVASIAHLHGEQPDNALKLAIGDDPRLLITFDEPVRFEGLYGLRRTTSHVLLRVDDETRFIALAEQHGLWREPAAPQPIAAPQAPKAPVMTREQWMRQRPAYMSEQEWLSAWEKRNR